MIPKKPPYFYRQSGAVVFKIQDDILKILIITSRKKKKWIIPKGIIEPGMSPSESAAKEAYEEAGVQGKIVPQKIGEYSFNKWGGTCTVSLYPMRCDNLLDKWAEDFRDRMWVTVNDAMNYITEPKLRKVILFLESKLPAEVFVK